MKTAIVILSALLWASPQVQVDGGIRLKGGLGFGHSGSVGWNPNLLAANLVLNNTPNCFTNCAPESGSTSVAFFPGMAETLFSASVTRNGSGTGTVTIAAGQGESSSSPAAYNFVSGDSVILAKCGSLNGTFPITSVSSPKVTVTMAGVSAAVSGCTAQRKTKYMSAQYIPAPNNVANYADDRVDIHDLIYGNGGYVKGSGDSVIVLYHIVPFQHQPSSGTCAYSPKPHLTKNGSHICVGYEIDSAAQVASQIAAIKRLSKPSAPSGVVYDWSGGPVTGQSSTMTKEKGAFDLYTSALSSQTAFKFAIAIDNSGWAGPCGSVSSQTPTCVEQVIENSLAYAKTTTTSTYTSPFDGVTRNGGGMFPSAAYLKDPATSRPVVAMWFNGESNFFTGCTGGSPCAVYNAGVAGTTCTSSSDCWTLVKTGIASYVSGWATSLKPEFIWRNSFSNNSVPGMNAGSFSWQNPSTDFSNNGYEDALITSAASNSAVFWASAAPRLDHAQSGFQDDALGFGDRCGQTWLNWLKRTSTAGTGGLFGPSAKPLWVMEIATWNDHEEGQALEPGINGCYSISATLSSSTLSWTLSTSDATNAPLPLNTSVNDTLDHVALIATGSVVGGFDSIVLDTKSPAQAGSFDLSTYHLPHGTYQVRLKLVPRAGIQTSSSAVNSFTF